MNIEPQIVSVQILQCVLRDNARCMEIRAIEDNLQDQINTGETVLKHRRHKDIIEQGKTLNDFLVPLAACFLHIECHRIPPYDVF